jgi:hypothetical protein
MGQPKALNARQLAVLRWIAAGCPDGGIDDPFHRISAGSLKRWRFVKVSGGGSTWKASITSIGTEYLARFDTDDAPELRRDPGTEGNDLLATLRANGDSILVPRPKWSQGKLVAGRTDWAQRVDAANRAADCPDDRWVTITDVPSDKPRRGFFAEPSEQLRITLVATPDGFAVSRGQVPVPSRVARFHPAVAAFAARRGSSFGGETRSRALRILHSLSTEAERRGHKVAFEPDGPLLRRYGQGSSYTEYRESYFRIVAHGIPTNVVVVPERKDPSRLTLQLEPKNWDSRRSSWTDRKTFTLEDKLPDVLREIEIRGAAAELERREKERQAQEDRRAWAAATELAAIHHATDGHPAALRKQMAGWREAHEVRAYCDAMANACGDEPETSEWVQWARGYADQLDPLRAHPKAPPAPTPTPEQIEALVPRARAALIQQEPAGHGLVTDL